MFSLRFEKPSSHILCNLDRLLDSLCQCHHEVDLQKQLEVIPAADPRNNLLREYSCQDTLSCDQFPRLCGDGSYCRDENHRSIRPAIVRWRRKCAISRCD